MTSAANKRHQRNAMKSPSPKDIPKIIKALNGAVNNVLLATARFELLDAEIKGYMTRVLAENDYFSTLEDDRPPRQGRPIGPLRDPKNAWHMGDVQFADYYAKVDAIQRAAGHNPKPGFCPALAAEALVRECHRNLVDLSEPFFGVNSDKLLNNVANYDKFVDLLIKMVVNHPRYKAVELNPAQGSLSLRTGTR